MKNRCLFSYEVTSEPHYSLNSLKKLNRNLAQLKEFPYSRKEQLHQAQKMATKLSIQGVQLKLSAKLSIKNSSFELCEKGGTYIVKPQASDYSHLPENEDLSMKLAHLAGIETPWHGLVRCKDNTLSYFIRRFDRVGKNKKLALEDFGQLIGSTRSTKYLATMERVAQVIEEFCTYPTVEFRKFFRRVLFNFLIGNEDMHVKNFSLITRNNKIELSPAYDLLNSTIAIASPQDELALELGGKKKDLKKNDFINYAKESLLLKDKVIAKEINQLLALETTWSQVIKRSFLNSDEKEKYLALLTKRIERFIGN